MPSAMGNKGEPREMSEAHLLAPWYAAGTLDEAEARELEELAKEDPEFAVLLGDAKREAEATVAVNEALGSPPREIWERIERSVEQSRRTQSSARISGSIEAVRNSFSRFLAGLTMPQWQAVAAIAVAICVIQVGAIAYLVHEKGPARYQAASGPRSLGAVKPSAFIVSFSPDAIIDEINRVLDDAGASIADGPNADGLYHIRLRDAKLTKDQVYKKLQASSVIKLVLPEK
jgi:hypothetical protein